MGIPARPVVICQAVDRIAFNSVDTMRKQFAFTMAILAILSCSRESVDIQQEEPQPEKKTINLTIVAGNPSGADTRTEIVGTKPYWSALDNLGVTSLTMDQEYYEEYEEEYYDKSILDISADSFPAEIAEFSGQIEAVNNSDPTLYAYYPGIPEYRYFDYSVFEEAPDYYGPVDYSRYHNYFFSIDRFDSDLVGARVLVSRFQQPSSTSFDCAADVLVAEPFHLSECEYDEEYDSYTLPDLRFARMVSVIELYLNSGENGPFEGQRPEYVELSYEGDDAIPLTGPAYIEFPKTKDDVPALHPYRDGWPDVDKRVCAYLGGYGNGGPEGPDDPEGPEGPGSRYTITAQPDEGPFTNPIYLVVFPGTLKAGGDLIVSAVNMDDYISVGRTIHLNRNLELQPGKITTLVIDLTGDEDDLLVDEKNTPGSIELEPVMHVDQYDNVSFIASVFGKNPEEEIVVDEDLFTCTFRDKNGDIKDVDYDLSYSYSDEVVTVTVYQLEDAEDLTVQVCYGAVSSNECTLKVYEAAEIPTTLGDSWRYYQYTSSWFDPYRIDRRSIDGKVYLKTYAASSRTEALPDNAFRGSFKSEDKGGSFDAFECFTQMTSIPTNAFYECVCLTGIRLPSGVTSIGTSAFNGCIQLTSMQLPLGVTSIGDFAFGACYDLASINLDYVLSIGKGAFSSCSLAGELNIGGATIGDNAFQVNTELQSVTIADNIAPGKVAAIGAGAFKNCSNLSVVNLPNSLSSIGDEAFCECSQLTSIDLPTSLETIGIGAFCDTGLTSLTIPASVTSIGRAAFTGCAFTYVIMEGETPADLGEGATDPDVWYSVFDADVTIYVPDTAVGTYQTAWPVLASRIKGISELTANN